MAKKKGAVPQQDDNEEETFQGDADLDQLFHFLADEEEDEEELKLKQELLVGFEAEASNVELNDINPEVRGQYNSSNASFVLWLFDHGFKDVFDPEIWNRFHRVMRKRHGSGLDDVREEIRSMLIKRETCPILLDKLNYYTFFTYIMSIKRDDGTFYSHSCYEGKKTSLSYLFKSFDKVQDENFKMKLSRAFKSLRKSIKREETKLGKKQRSGKDIMTFECYKFMCRKLLSSGDPEDIFGLCFLTLQWNLMSRSESTETLSINNMRWEEDHMKAFFPKHKSDQAGLTSSEPRHVYSNALDPSICPIRALGAYLIAFPGILSSSHGRLFPGDNQKKRFGKQLHTVLKKHYHEFQDIGVDPKDIGTHSIRKGAATFCTCAVHPGPPIVSVCLRAGWTIGRVKERYLKYEASGDQLVGRCLSGIDPQNKQFSISPVYFYNLNDKTEKQMRQLTKYAFPVARGTFVKTSRMLLANYIFNEAYHAEKVKNTRSLLLDNAYYANRNSFPGRLHHVRFSCPWDSVDECPSYTGIPLHCSILNKLIEVSKLQTQVYELQLKLPGEVAKAVKNELNKDDSNTSDDTDLGRLQKELKNMNNLMKKALDVIAEQKKQLGEKHSNNVSFDGSQHSNDDTITLEDETSPEEAEPEENALPISAIANKENKVTKIKSFGVWAHYWDGKIRKVPKTFEFPKGKPLLSVFLDWHLPNMDKKYPPLQSLDSFDVANVNRGTQRLSELRLVMNTFITFITQHATSKIRNLYEQGKKKIEILTEVFDSCKHLYTQEKPSRRIEQMSWESFVTESRNWKLRGFPSITGTPQPSRKPRAPRAPRQTTISTTATKRTTATTATMASKKTKRKTATTVSSQRKKRKASSSSTTKTKQKSKSTTSNANTKTVRPRGRPRKNTIDTEEAAASFNYSVAKTTQSTTARPPHPSLRPTEKITRLRRTGANTFETVKCAECGNIPTHHRCMFEVKVGGFMDGTKQICGQPFCLMCANDRNCVEMVMRCAKHNVVDT